MTYKLLPLSVVSTALEGSKLHTISRMIKISYPTLQSMRDRNYGDYRISTLVKITDYIISLDNQLEKHIINL